MKATVYADKEEMGIMVIGELVIQTMGEKNINLGDKIGEIDAPDISLQTVRLMVAPMLARAELPPSGWTIRLALEERPS